MRLTFKNVHKGVRFWQSNIHLKLVSSIENPASNGTREIETASSNPQQFQVYSSLSKTKETLKLKTDNLVTWYSCGPTVYDNSHIGHAICYIRFDLIRRILESHKFAVVYAMNVTDIDDKIIQRAKDLNLDFQEVAKKYEASFFQDLLDLNVRMPSIVLRATEYMKDIVHFIQELIKLNYAYTTSQGVFFDTARDAAYPRFRHMNVDETVRGVKRNVRDFALWKPAKQGEPFWETPFGPGRPGWHIECSTMASKVFGDRLDVHSGGKDLEFPHHENEEAQCCAFHGRSNWATHYIHSGYVKLSGEKMSKSIGNVLTIKEMLKKYTADQLRMMCLRLPYWEHVEIREPFLNEAVSLLAKLSDALALSDDYLRGRFSADINQDVLLRALRETQTSVDAALLDNFDFARATARVMILTQMLVNELRRESRDRAGSGAVAVASVSSFIRNFYIGLGFRLDTSQAVADDLCLKSILDKAVDFRFEMRKLALSSNSGEQRNHLLARCDNFRKVLEVDGVLIKDHVDRSSWVISK
ncbi:cysteine--tRNA ligase [Tropilaelaps mercedesae]|uniref:cysteine--tRNA ligase n=1 Tax=Tropilaelaps mercedesae TaxID=418985 RepID=A0A1V9XXK2_9ACAR|nr:cysteine--tRNA ligase [Tropilaelaps mercedesae]